MVANATSNATSGGATKDYNYDSWMALLSQLPLLLFTLLNSFLYQWVKERIRVAFSLIFIFLLFSLTAALVEVNMQPDTFFSVTMATVWFINMFGAVLQSGLFGVVGLFPPRYSTLFMSGQGLAGIFAAIAMLCSILMFAVTLSVFPVITVRVQTVYKDNKAWKQVFTCVCCFIVFNTMDLVGRSAPSLVQWPSKESRLFPVAVLSRLVFIPLLMLCNVENPRLTVLFTHDCAFVTIMALFSFSNGYLASLCMAYAPQLVRYKDCETAGSLMTFFLVLGLAVGASFSFLLGKLVTA
ncbi:equilibrative nucleoside transporter 2-like [Seriola lalandi dorsalis]|uniref:equilibrative nucleoside transporter 2-like n=1 Tax=Seriola lalandi dorsalis TaxID=1841481 RepID=UPI000C6FAE46|nr:equilibrative nucleoside transporter 2-like [Seriola lalandi dorsalis]